MRVFISYRRADTRDVAGRLADRLRHTRGISEVFVDVDEIVGGQNFVKAVEVAISKSSVRLILIGPAWSSVKNEDGTPRIMDADDPVTLEVLKSLSTPGRTIPVLIEGTHMPSKRDLPESLEPLLELNAMSLRHESFDADFEELIASCLGRSVRRNASLLLRRPILSSLLWGLAGFVASSVIGIAFLLTNRNLQLVSLPLGGSDEAATSIVLAWLFICTLFPALIRAGRKRVR